MKGNESSAVYVSLENRFRMRPRGEMSKNTDFAYGNMMKASGVLVILFYCPLYRDLKKSVLIKRFKLIKCMGL